MGDSTLNYGINGRWVRSRAITEADTDSVVDIVDIPAGTLIPPHAVMIQVLTLFAGGTPSIDIGDADDDDGWIDTTAITETTAGPYADVDAALAVTGKYYASAGKIKATVSASLTAGKAYVFVYMIDVADVIGD